MKAAPAVKDNTYLEGIFEVGAIVDDFEKTVASLKSHSFEVAYGPFAAKGSEPANVTVRSGLEATSPRGSFGGRAPGLLHNAM